VWSLTHAGNYVANLTQTSWFRCASVTIPIGIRFGLDFYSDLAV
jgi:hypothetical protein